MKKNQTVYHPVGRVVTRRIGSDTLLVPVSGSAASENAVFPVNGTGLFAWERLSAGKSIDETACAMSEMFDVEVELARTDCVDLVKNLVDQNLLQVDLS